MRPSNKAWLGWEDNGYLGVVSQQAEAQTLVNEVNQNVMKFMLNLAAYKQTLLLPSRETGAQKAYAKNLSKVINLWVEWGLQRKIATIHFYIRS